VCSGVEVDDAARARQARRQRGADTGVAHTVERVVGRAGVALWRVGVGVAALAKTAAALSSIS